jgi:hypothetical protein
VSTESKIDSFQITIVNHYGITERELLEILRAEGLIVTSIRKVENDTN